MGDFKVTGGCMCGSVRYLITSEPVGSAVCHCESCRRSVGAHSVAWFCVPILDFCFTDGRPSTYESLPQVERTFCSTCGTALTYFNRNEKEFIDITIASLDDPSLFPPKKDYFYSEKISWVKPATEVLKD